MKKKIYYEGDVELYFTAKELVHEIFDRPDEYSLEIVNQMLINIIEVLGEIPAEKIALLPDQVKKTVASILKLQALRYSMDDEAIN